MATAPANTPEYSVSEIAGAVKRTVETAFGQVRVRGEISGLKLAASGHAYLCLKDERAVLDGVMWKAGVQALRFRPEDGLEVIATGRLTTYPGRSKYQIVIESLEPAGAGALMALLEQRKAKLAAEGLFHPGRKRRLPFLPATIGVVTSPTGAVIRDILHRLADRFPRRVIVWPVLVQGEGAAAQVAAAVDGFNAITGPVREELRLTVADLALRAERANAKCMAARAERVAAVACRLPSPRTLLGHKQQRFDDLADRLPRGLSANIQVHRTHYERAGAALRPALVVRFAERAAARLDATARLFASLDYKATLARGFALVRDRDGVPITRVAAAKSAQTLQIEFADGHIAADTRAVPRQGVLF